MSVAAGAYLPSSSPAWRAWLLSVIVGVHVVALLSVLSIKGVAVIVERAPMLVRLMPEPLAPKPALPARIVPLPQIRKPEVRIPEPPSVEILQMVEVVQRPTPAPPPPRESPPARFAAPAAPPAFEPPRFDLAYLNNPAPAYPVFAKRAREQGVVTLRVRVDASGNVEGVDLQKSSGSERLDRAALAAVRRWRFVPARQGDRPVAGVAIVPINFQLES